MPSLPITEYAREVKNTYKTSTTEFTLRTPLENLLLAIAKEVESAGYGELEVVHEPPRESGIGAPDFLIRRKATGAVVGCVECKKIGEDLTAHIGKSQLEKYCNLSPNIILTNYRHFYLLRDNKIVLKKELGDTAAARKEVEELIRQFLSAEADNIGDVKILVAMLATWCKLLREGLEKKLPDDNTSLRGLFESFKLAIYRDIEIKDFADALAQTLVYGLLLAKLKTETEEDTEEETEKKVEKKTEEKLDLYNMDRHIPQNFALVREITGFLEKLDDKNYTSIKYLVENILAVINGMDVEAVNESMARQQKGTDEQDDPYLYFYEIFLAAYNHKLRKSRGVYYTPPPVVRFIVRAADDILRRDFKFSEGLAKDKVTALDFATGTGTFYLEMIRLVFNSKNKSERNLIARRHLLKNFYGFEYLIAPYTIAHIKLSQFLKNKGVKLKDNERINVYLTNTLDRLSEQIEISFMPKLAEETNSAEEIKEHNTLIVTGNPPYSGVSQNKGEWITGLIEDYKWVDGEPLGEQNSRALQDDYVKFIRFAQWKMSKVEQGIVAIITNHAFMDNLTFRGMRQNLLNSFDRLYFLDLHGNSKKKERTPEGEKDENVFDIQQGVAISLLIKNKDLSKGVFHADFWGTRENKYELCAEQDIENIEWEEIYPDSPYHLFIPWDRDGIFPDYQKKWKITDIFQVSNSGIKTHRDEFAFTHEREEIVNRANDMIDATISDEEFRRCYDVQDTQGWKLSEARDEIRQIKDINERIHQCLYRPFDLRWCFYGKETMDRPRSDVMNHMLVGDNIALVTVRQVAEDVFNHVFITNKITDMRITLSNKGSAFILPLYHYTSEMGKLACRENFNPEFRKWMDSRYGTKHTPEDILGCIYAILHSPSYRRRYTEFLRFDFPHIPFPEDNAEFKRLAKIGNELIAAHLLLREDGTSDIRLCGDGITRIVNKIEYDEDEERLYFNDDEYLSPISSEVFNFQIGGYQSLVKFLQSHNGRDISADIPTLISAANAIAFTLAAMKKIDK